LGHDLREQWDPSLLAREYNHVYSSAYTNSSVKFGTGKGKGNVVPTRTVKARGDVCGQLQAPATLSAVPIVLEVSCSSASFWNWLFIHSVNHNVCITDY
jgi:hypothetical protein